MDTPIIAQYYREKDPAKRRELLEQAIAQEGIPRKIRFVRKSGMHVMAWNLTWEDGQTVI